MLAGLFCVPLGLLLFFSVIVGVFVFFGKLPKVASPKRVLAEVASELGFTYERKLIGESKYVGQYRGRKVAFSLQDLPKGDTSIRVIRICAWHRGTVEKEVTVKKPPLSDIDLGKMTGLKTNKPTHNPEFDAKFEVYGMEGDIRRLVDSDMQARLLELEPQLLRTEGLANALTCYTSMVEVYIQSLQAASTENGVNTAKDTLKKAVNLACDAAERAERG